MNPLPERMRSEDHSELVELWSRFPGNTLTGADGPAGFEGFLDMNGDFCFVARDGGRLVGSVMAGNDGRRGYIYHLAVDPGHRDRGLGADLMQACESALAAFGLEKIHLFIYRDNPAIEFYRRIGWHTREDIEVMSKVLIGDRLMGTRSGDGD